MIKRLKHSKLRQGIVSSTHSASVALAELLMFVPSHAVRLWIYKNVYQMQVGNGSTIYRTPEVRAAHKIRIGKNSSIGKNAILDGRCGISIGDNVNLSSEVAIWSLQHDVQDPNFAAVGGPVVVGDRAWLSFRATVLPGVSIGEGAVVAANAVVTKDVAPYAIVAGIPARVIGERNHELRYTLSGRSLFL